MHVDQEDTHWQRLIHGLRAGDESIVREFCGQYGELLHDLADRHLGTQLRRRVEPEDVVQSVCRTFLRRARAGQFALPDSGALWRLLCAITLNKVRQQARHHRRHKRGMALDKPLAHGSAWHPAASDPMPSDAAAFAEQFARLMDALDAEERHVVDLKMQDHTNEEVAECLGLSERTVRRILKRIQTRLTRSLEA